MNRGRQLLLDIRPGGLNPLAIRMLEVLDISRHCTLRILFAKRQQVDLGGLRQEVFKIVVVVSLVAVDNGLFGQVEVKSLGSG